jgi:Bacterial Ig-like domain (group 3)
MPKNRFLTRLSSGAFVVFVVTGAGGALVVEGVADATPLASVHQTVATSTPTKTTTTLSTSVSSVVQGNPVTLTATISPAKATGTVQFKDGAANLENPVPVSTGTVTATISTSTLTVGKHWLTAAFTPTDPATYDPSASQPVVLDVTAPTGATTTPRATILTQSTASIDLLPLPKVELAAKLIEASTGKPVAERMIDFYGGDQLLCHDVTDATGWARCSGAENFGPQTIKEVLAGYYAVFTGDGEYGPSTQHTSATIGTASPKP